MRLTRLVLPLAFLVLGALSTGLLLALQYAPVLPTVVAAVVSTAVASLVWMAAIGESPSWRRGAAVAAVAAVIGSFVSMFPAKVAINVHETATYENPLLEVGVSDLYMAFVLLTGSVLVVPLALAVGALVARFPMLAPQPLDAFDVRFVKVPEASETRRQLGALALVVCLLVGTAAVIQYTDPTTPDVGDAPAYAGADAPADVQSTQALLRTRSVSHTVRGQYYRVYENGTESESTTFVVRHDLQRDLIRYEWAEDPGNSGGAVLTEDASWSCLCDYEPLSSIPPNNRPPSTAYPLELPTETGVTVVEKTENTVTLRYSKPHDWDGRTVDTPLDQTVTINRETGRLRSMNVRWRNKNKTWRVRVQFEGYGETSVEPPKQPGRPLSLHVQDLLHGPLNGETPLHQWGDET